MLQVKFMLACENSRPCSLLARVAFSREWRFRETPLGWKSFSAVFERLALNSESSSGVTLLLHADWMIVKNVSNQGRETAWLLLLGTQNPSHGCWLLRKLHFLKIIWWLALGFLMELRLNGTRRSINLSVYLVFDLEAGWLKFLGENLLGSGAVEMGFSLDSS